MLEDSDELIGQRFWGAPGGAGRGGGLTEIHIAKPEIYICEIYHIYKLTSYHILRPGLKQASRRLLHLLVDVANVS